MKKIYKENLLGKCALMWALQSAFDLNRGCACDFIYENDKDRIEFKCCGHKCRLLSVDEIDYENGTITMTILAKGVELEKWEVLTMCFVAKHFRYETLRKIVVEYYMCSGACHNDTWESDVDAFITDKQADWFDSYDSFMGYR